MIRLLGLMPLLLKTFLVLLVSMKSFRKCLVALVVAVAILSVPNSVGALDKKGLTLSPLRSEMNITPGTSLGGKLKITNSTDRLMPVQLSAEEFRTINPEYDYEFTPESDVVKWVVFSSTDFTLSAGESKDIDFMIGVPITAEAGGRYISLFATTDSSATGGDANSHQRIASLLYITVLGNLTQIGNLISLNTPWLVSGDSDWSMSLQNTGSTHFHSRYTVQVQKLLGDGFLTESTDDAMILPGTVRTVSSKIPLPQLPGIYKVIYAIGLGDKPAVTENRWMVYLPVWSIIALVLLIASAVLWLLRKKIFSKH